MVQGNVSAACKHTVPASTYMVAWVVDSVCASSKASVGSTSGTDDDSSKPDSSSSHHACSAHVRICEARRINAREPHKELQTTHTESCNLRAGW